MAINLRATYWVGLLYTVLGVLLWRIPLLNHLHAESSAVLAGAGFFLAGFAALKRLPAGARLPTVWIEQLLWTAVPLGVMLAPRLWQPACALGPGLLFFGLFVPVSVTFGVALAYVLTARPGRDPRLLFVLLGVGLGVGGVLYDLGLHPQFYTYNHVFGGVLGPIYDETLAVRPGLFVFRGLTLLWAGLLVAAGYRLRHPGARRVSVAALGLGLVIGTVYLFSSPLGLNTSTRYLQGQFSGHAQTVQFDLYYDTTAVTPTALDWHLEDHAFRYHQLAESLNTAPEARIQSYLYPNAEMKGRLTGARQTNVAPVWLAQPQTHVLQDAYPYVFPHELVHAFSRPFGMPVLKASRAVGLVEGLAVALEPPDGYPAPHAQLAAAMAGADSLGYTWALLAEDVAARLSPVGFWTGRGAVSYATMGSFVRFLLDRYGVERFKRAYAWADFEAAYDRPVAALAEEWTAFLQTQPVTPSATQYIENRFARLSLFEQPCPHDVPPGVQAYQRGEEALAAGDSTAALAAFEAARRAHPNFAPATRYWAHLALAQGRAAAVADTLQAQIAADTVRAGLYGSLPGDALALLGQPVAARAAHALAAAQLPVYARVQRAMLDLHAAVADTPVLVRTLVAGGAPLHKAERLAPILDALPLAHWLQALYYAEAEAFVPARDALEAAPVAGLPEALLQQRRVWQSTLHVRTGTYAQARAYAEEARRYAVRTNDPDEARRLADWLAKIAWRIKTNSPPSTP